MIEVSTDRADDIGAALDELKQSIGVEVSIHEIEPDVL